MRTFSGSAIVHRYSKMEARPGPETTLSTETLCRGGAAEEVKMAGGSGDQ